MTPRQADRVTATILAAIAAAYAWWMTRPAAPASPPDAGRTELALAVPSEDRGGAPVPALLERACRPPASKIVPVAQVRHDASRAYVTRQRLPTTKRHQASIAARKRQSRPSKAKASSLRAVADRRSSGSDVDADRVRRIVVPASERL